MQFAVERVRAGIKRRVAKKALGKVLDKGADADKASARAVNTAELARLWGSFAFRELRADLPPHQAEELHRRLAAVLAGEEGSAEVWWATISALRDVRRSAEVPIGAPSRKWRQSFPDLNGW